MQKYLQPRSSAREENIKRKGVSRRSRQAAASHATQSNPRKKARGNDITASTKLHTSIHHTSKHHTNWPFLRLTETNSHSSTIFEIQLISHLKPNSYLRHTLQFNSFQFKMSFITRTSFRTASRLQFCTPRTAAFSTSFVAYKGPVETVKEGVKTVDHAVSQKIVEGIELGGMFLFLFFSEFPSRSRLFVHYIITSRFDYGDNNACLDGKFFTISSFECNGHWLIDGL